MYCTRTHHVHTLKWTKTDSISSSNLNSSHWYTSQPLDASTLQSMLTRILAVREVRHEKETAQLQYSAAAEGDVE